MALIKGGDYTPLYGRDSAIVEVDDFNIDIYPVTNNEFRTFLKEYPKWKKENVIALFADDAYLTQFTPTLSLKEGYSENGPVVSISWFAAKNYCECQGKRLPTLNEWEYVGMADENAADAREKDEYNQFILSWYEKPTPKIRVVGSTFENYWGVYDMHGLVWEWTADFNSVMISGESRRDNTENNSLFCSGAAIGSNDLMNYAAFMRYAFRGSVKAKYSIKNLGFRCAKDIEENQ